MIAQVFWSTKLWTTIILPVEDIFYGFYLQNQSLILTELSSYRN